jgi:hypothetical protein
MRTDPFANAEAQVIGPARPYRQRDHIPVTHQHIFTMECMLTASRIIEILREDQHFATWLDYLDEIGPPPVAIPLVDGDAFMAALADLDVPVDDIETLISLRFQIESDPDLWWILVRAVHSLLLRMDIVDSPPGFHPMPIAIGRIAPFFYVYVFVMMLDHTKALHHRRSIPGVITIATMADIGRNMLVHRKRHGTHGLAAPDWLTLHPRGMIYQLGRLQFERSDIDKTTGDAIAAVGLPYRTGDSCLSIHIPDFMGSMSAAACDDSFHQASIFFADHFPEEEFHIAVCNSWLLDEQLKDYLKPASNVLSFQSRFRQIRPAEWNNDGPIRFVFGPIDEPLESLPQDTSIQRAVVSHIQAGRSWHGGLGWMEL